MAPLLLLLSVLRLLRLPNRRAASSALLAVRPLAVLLSRPSLFLMAATAAARHESRLILDCCRERCLQRERVPHDGFHCHADVVPEAANVHALYALIARLIMRVLLHLLRVLRPQFPEEPVPSRTKPFCNGLSP
jgi:hypothetical protein